MYFPQSILMKHPENKAKYIIQSIFPHLSKCHCQNPFFVGSPSHHLHQFVFILVRFSTASNKLMKNGLTYNISPHLHLFALYIEPYTYETKTLFLGDELTTESKLKAQVFLNLNRFITSSKR